MKQEKKEKQLWNSINHTRKIENKAAKILKNHDIQIPHVSIRYAETFNKKEVTYQGKIDSACVIMHYVFSGNLSFTPVPGNRTTHLQSSHQYIHFIAPGSEYKLTYPKQTLVKWLRIVIDLDFMKDMMNRLHCQNNWLAECISTGQVFVDYKGMPYHPGVAQSLRALINPPVAKTTHPLFVTSKVMELLSYTLSNETHQGLMQYKGLSNQDVTRFNDLKEYLDRQFTEDHSIAGLAKRFGINECKLKKGFKTLFDSTVFGYINDLKMQKARQMLKEGYAVSEVSYVLGYNYPQHFSKAFKNKFGVTPSQYTQPMGLAG